MQTTIARGWLGARGGTCVAVAVCRTAAVVAFLLLVSCWPGSAAAQSLFDEGSAVADFNADGRPDLAVAGDIGDRGSADYRIDVQLSNGRHESISFASAQRALRIAAVDVDNDHDLDLIVTPLLGRDIVGVWLNDGAGHFRPGDPDAVPPDAGRCSSGAVAGCPPQLAISTPIARRFAAVPPMRGPTTRATDAGALIPPSTVVASPHLLAASLSPRGPPSAS